MRWYVAGIVSLLLPVLGYCSATKEKAPSLVLQESESLYSESSLQIITEAEVRQQLKQAVERAEKLPGIADMMNPNYKFDLDGDMYFLWISEESGVIMNTLNTHTVYTLQLEDVKEVHHLLKSGD